MFELELENRFRTPFIFVVKEPPYRRVQHGSVRHSFHSLSERVYFAPGATQGFCSSFSLSELARVKERFPNMGRYATSMSEAIEKGVIEVYTRPNRYNPTETTRLRGEIQRVLNDILHQENAEAAQIAAQHAQRNRLEKAAAWGGAVAEGFGESASSFLIWAKDVVEVVSIQARIQRVVEAQLSTYWEVGPPWDDPEAWIKRFQSRLKDAEYKELIDVLGFDPRQVETEKVARAYEIAQILYDDPDMHATLKRFASDYASAQHGLEIAHMAGGALFEIVLTAVLVFLTAGLGVAAQASHKLRLSVDALKRLGKLFVELTEQLKRRKILKRRQPKRTGNADSKPSGRSTFDDGPVGGEVKPRKLNSRGSSDEKSKRAPKSKSLETVGTDTKQPQDVAQNGQWNHLSLSERHIPGRVTIPKKTGNTMLTVTPDEAAADLAEIHKSGDKIRIGETFKVSSGRVYGVHNNSVHPISGPGTVDITSAEYNILVTARKKGIDKAEMSLNKMTEKGIFSQDQYDRTKSLLELMNKKDN